MMTEGIKHTNTDIKENEEKNQNIYMKTQKTLISLN